MFFILRLFWYMPLVVYFVIYHRTPLMVLSLFQDGLAVGLIGTLMLFGLLAVFYLPLIVVWRAVSRTLKKEAIKQTSFPVLEDFDYYRDVLTGISPTTISMCVDFAVERDKDLAAQLLKFTMQGLIAIDGNQITVLQAEPPADLMGSERYLLAQLRGGALTESVADIWAEQARTEVLAGAYFKQKKPPKYAKQRVGNTMVDSPYPAATPKERAIGCMGCLPMVITIALIFWLINSPPVLQFATLAETDLSNAAFITLLVQDPSYLLGIFIILGLGILFFVSLAVPFAGVIWGYLITQNKMKDRYKRTEAGEILTEEIYGLKNFLHDFSDLEHAQKEALVLWDDFLIYAVVLEENASIVSEITAMRNLTVITPEYTK